MCNSAEADAYGSVIHHCHRFGDPMLSLRSAPVLFQNSVERSCRLSVVMAEDSAESFASRDRA